MKYKVKNKKFITVMCPNDTKVTFLVILKTNMRSIRLKYDYKENYYVVSANSRLKEEEIVDFFFKYYPSYNRKMIRRMYVYNNQTYYYGVRYTLSELSTYLNEEITSLEDLYKISLPTFYKYLEDRVNYHKEQLGIKTNYKIKVHLNDSTFGSNNYVNKTLIFSYRLIHFDKDVIDSVVEHELIHHFYHNHQKEYYAKLLMYDPNYKRKEKALKDGFNYEISRDEC